MRLLALKDLIGQDIAVNQLKKAAEKKSPAPSYLFYGPQGTGRRTAAVAFSAALNCRGSGADACLNCGSCAKIRRGVHPDLLVVEPARDTIKLAQVREIGEFTSTPALEGTFKVVIIDPADGLTVEAQNYLLKLLEEPKGNEVFILITSRAGAVLSTVISRCQIIKFQLLKDEVVADLLVQEGYGSEEARWASRLARGSVDLAKGFLSPEVREQRERVLGMMEKLSQADLALATSLAARLAGEKDDFRSMWRWVAYWYRDKVVWTETQREELVFNLDKLNSLSGGKVDSRIMNPICQALKRERYHANKELLWTVLLLQLSGFGEESWLADGNWGTV
ncbi:MAG: DNA polymerase III subunit delta' [Clostridia bacterium]|nr:DNA polymerase III subunit delta' [Clostridia bacterium]